MFGQLIATLKKSPKTIVFTEGTDPRILEASARLLSGNFLKPVLVGNPEEIAAAAEDAGFNIRGAEIADPANYPEMDAMVEQMVELRKGKMTPEQCRDALKKGNYFGTMLVKMGVADCLLGGATYSTADTVRPALQLIKTKPGSNIVSSCFIMVRPAASGENEVLAMAEKYRQPNLCNYYCANQCPIGQEYVPEIKIKDLSQIVLEMLASLNAMNKRKDRLIEITADDKISDDELEDFLYIQEELERISITVETLQLWAEKMLAAGVIDEARYEAYRSRKKT